MVIKTKKQGIVAFQNNVNCDIYLGKGAGKKILEDIYNAKKSLKIISPYFSEELISNLISICESKKIEVIFITTFTERYFKNFTERQKELAKYKIFLRQERFVNENSLKNIDKWRKTSKNLFLVTIISFLVILMAVFYLKDTKILMGLLLPFIFYILRIKNQYKILDERIYNYSYKSHFPLKIYKTSDLHSKIFIIDDEIAYLGSVNFTNKGTKYNYETRIRTTDKNALKAILKEFNELLYTKEFYSFDIQKLGKELFNEPIN